MNDIRGVGIKLGCEVAVVDRSNSKRGQPAWGTVIGFSKQMVRVRLAQADRETSYMPYNCCVIQLPKETEMKEL